MQRADLLRLGPADDRTAAVLSDMMGKTTITSKTESQARIRDLDDSANISRRNEERPLFSPGTLLQFPLDEVLILPEGQYPIRARHIRYYEDHHFAPIDRARQGHPLPYPPVVGQREKAASPVVKAEREIETVKGLRGRFAGLGERALRGGGGGTV